MPAVSQAQQRFMGMVHATQTGKLKNPSPAVARAAKSMKPGDAKDFASTKHKGLPEHKEEPETRHKAAWAGIRAILYPRLGRRFTARYLARWRAAARAQE